MPQQDDFDRKIRELEESNRILQIENDELAERAEDTLLLGLIAEQIGTAEEVGPVLERCLERISVLKDIPFCACCSLAGNEAVVIKSYLSFSEEELDKHLIVLPTDLLRDISDDEFPSGSGVWEGAGLSIKLASGFFKPASVFCIPFASRYAAANLFLFADDRTENRFPRLSNMLHRVVEMTAARVDNIVLLQDLRALNRTLDNTVEERTRELQKREHEFRSLAESLPDNIVRHDREGRVVYISPALEKTLGTDAARMFGKRIREIYPDGSYEVGAQAVDAALASGEDGEIEFTMPVPGKGPIVHQIRTVVERDEQGEVSGVLSIGRDITERKRAEAALAASEQQFRSLAENSPDNIVRYDRQCRLIYYNPMMAQSMPFDAEPALGKTPTELDFGGPEVSAEYEKHIRQVLQNGESSDMELTVPDAQDEPRSNLIRFTAEFDTEGEVSGVLAIGRDITALKQAEQERQLHTDFLAKLDRINRAIQGADDIETMMGRVLDEALSIFDCDRAVLAYPCDPDAATWTSPMERTHPDYPGLGTMGLEIPMDQEVAAMFELMLKTPGVVKFGPGTDRPLPEAGEKVYGIKSFMAMALFPKTGKPWQLGLHQCSFPRIWTEAEEQLLMELGRRLADGLSSMLMQRDLIESEARYQRLFDTANEGIWIQDQDFITTFINEHMAQMLGYTPDELMHKKVTDFMTEEDALDHVRKMEERRRNISDVYERRLLHRDGSVVWMLISATPTFEDGQFRGSFSMLTDITKMKEAESKLASSEQLFRTLVEHSPDFIARYDLNLNRIYINPTLQNLFATSSDQVIGKTPTTVSPLNEPERYMDAIRQTIDSATEQTDELTFHRPDGDTRWAHIRFVPEFDLDGNVATVMMIASDITQQKQAEEEQRIRTLSLANMDRINRAIQSANDLETMMSNVLDEVLDIFDCDRAYLLYPCDPAAESFSIPMECTRPDFPGVSTSSTRIPTDAEISNTQELLLHSSGALQFGPGTTHPVPASTSERYGIKSFMAIALPPKTGKAWEFGIQQCSGARIWTHDEEVQFQEIARRLIDGLTSMLIQRDLIESEAKYRRIVDTANEGILILDEHAEVVFLNAHLAKMLGYTLDELQGHHVTDFMLQEYLADHQQKLNHRHQHLAETYERRLIRKDGSILWALISATPILDGNQYRGALSMVTDITEQKLKDDELHRYKSHLEDEVQQRTVDLELARNAAEAANKAKSVFLANMSHELRTPLNAILGFSSLMYRNTPSDTEQHENLEIINRSGEHLLNLINDVLEMAKIEAGRMQLEVAPFDLGSMVRDLIEMMQLRCQEKGLQLLLDQSSDFPRYIKGDESRLRQILLNLLSNAVKFTHEGGVTVRLGVRENDRQHLLIEVQDTGQGVTPEDQARLFKPFVKLSDDPTQQGTGLGLTITRQFVQMMGGDITISSEAGKGSIFRVELPLDAASEDDIVTFDKHLPAEIIGLAPDQPTYRILIAEDQHDNQLLLSRLMTNLGINIKVAENGEQCVELFQLWHPDLIWMDRRMPIMDGVEATLKIRQLPDGDKVKIIAVTASAFTEQQNEMLDAGMDDFVSKPYRFNEIYDCLARHLGMKFIYAQATDSALPPLQLTPEMFESTPKTLRNQLHSALLSLDSKLIAETIRQFGDTDSELRRALTFHSSNFDYPAILKVLDSLVDE